MQLVYEKFAKKILAMILVAATVLGLLYTGDSVIYAYTAQGGMINSPDGTLVETKKTANPNGTKANALVHGKPLTVIDEVTGTDGALWYKVVYYTANGDTKNTAYCPAAKVRLDKDVVVISTGSSSANHTLWSCTNEYKKPELTTIPAGTKLYITDSKNDGGLWYRVYCEVSGTTVYGWVESAYVVMDAIPDVPTDGDYEQQLINQGFPASYARYLAVLHEQYPSWVFVPVQTGLDWNTVIKEESKAGRNLIQTSANDAKKSTASTEYNYYTNKWTIRDSSGWVTAHPDYIAYCMDPRNYLNANDIFMFESLRYTGTQNAQGVQSIIKNTFMAKDVADTEGTLNYAGAFMAIGQALNVSPYHLAARVKQEQGTKGTSPLISGTYKGFEGYYNYFNVGAYGTPNSVLYERGLTYAKNAGWNSRYAALLGGSKVIADKYIGVGQDTLYFQKFNVVYKNSLYTHQYMTNVEAALSEGRSMAKAYADKTQAFVFHIPVYNNMPESAVQFTASGNRNNYLAVLSVVDYLFTPTFDSAVTEYSIIVPATTTSVQVTASPVVSSSKVSGTGTYNLVTGSNTIKVKCTSQSGETKTYTITIVRESGEVIRGDISGDGLITIVDLVRLNRHILNVSTLSGVQLEAADVNGNGSVNIQDLVLLNRHILGISTIN